MTSHILFTQSLVMVPLGGEGNEYSISEESNRWIVKFREASPF